MNFRYDTILGRARADGKVTVESLAQELDVTVQTIRRDLTALCEAGHLTRVHGGAVLPSGTRNIGYEDRRSLHSEEKARIGAAVAREIPNGASVFLDIGTTIEAVASNLLHHRGLMVVTNNIRIAGLLAPNPEIEIVIAGGVLRRADGGLVGELTADVVRQFRVDIAVLAASALDPGGDVLDYDFREVRVAQAMLSQARRTCLAADATKFGRGAPVRMAGIADFSVFVTDAPPPASFRAAAEAGGTTVTVAA